MTNKLQLCDALMIIDVSHQIYLNIIKYQQLKELKISLQPKQVSLKL